jgi:pimeloyl-ACP methyl ester carboxylesterase
MHGLGGAGVDTWRIPKKTGSWPEWLLDDDLELVVWLIDYGASPTRSGVSMPIFDRATNLLDAMEAHGIGRRPVVFVGHSLGGLVIKQIIRHSVTADDQFRDFAKQVRAVIFFATPHDGSALADVISIVGRLFSSDLSQELRLHLPSLRELDIWYANYVARTGLPNLVYTEGRPTKGIRVVSDTSGNPHLPFVTPIRLDEDHLSICKLPDPTHHVYRGVQRFIAQHATITDGRDAESPPEIQSSARPQAAARALRLLEPQRLPAVERDYLRSVYEQLSRSTVTAVIGAAGSGKSVALGQIAHRLIDEGRSVVLVPCSLADGARIAPSYQEFIEPIAVAAGFPVGTSEVAAFAKERPVVLIDTVDIVLSPTSRSHLDRFLGDLEQAGATVLMTCRPQEFYEYLEPAQVRLSSLRQAPSLIEVPHLSEPEIELLVTAYLEHLGKHPPKGRQAFVQALLGLASSRRPMQDIVRSPLMLGMVCDLYGGGGTIPPDLDVGRLYRIFWHEKVDRTRSSDTQLIAAKQRICGEMAAMLWHRSQGAIQEWCSRQELSASDIDLAALGDLMSEGVLSTSPLSDRSVRFMHQTFCEYAMAMHLADQRFEAELTAALDVVRTTPYDVLHWWPVLRETLAVKASQGLLADLVQQLPRENLSVIRGLAFAAARGDHEVLAALISESIVDISSQFSRECREIFREVLSAVDARHAATAIRMLNALLDAVPVDELPRTAIVAARLTLLLEPQERPDAALASLVSITARIGSSADEPSDTTQEAVFRHLEILAEDPSTWISSELRAGIRRLLPKWRNQAFRAAILAHSSLEVPEADRRALADVVNLDRADGRPRDSVVMAIRLARPWAAAGDGTADDLLTFLTAEGLSNETRNLRSTAVGAEAACWPEALELLGRTFREGRPTVSEACFVALRATCQNGGAEAVADLVCRLLSEALVDDGIPDHSVQQVAGLIIDELADRCTAPVHERLRTLLADCLDDYLDDRTISALASIADDDLEIWNRIIAAVPHVAKPRLGRTLSNVMGGVPSHVAAQLLEPLQELLATHAPDDKFLRARLLGKAAITDQLARQELLALAQDRSTTAAKQAIHQIRITDAARIWLQPMDLRPILLDEPRLLVAALVLLHDIFRYGSPQFRDRDETNLLMRDLLQAISPPPPEAVRGDGPAAARMLDIESRLLACCYGWLRVAAANDDGGEAATVFTSRMDAMCAAPSKDPAIQRALLLLIMQAAWRSEHPQWQARANSWLIEILQVIDPDPVEEGPRTVLAAMRRLLASGVTNQAQLVERSSQWTLGGLKHLLVVVLERDPLGASGPATRTLLERDRGGVLAAIVAHKQGRT